MAGTDAPPVPTFVDVFSGAGGLSLGLSDAGWECLLAVDSWEDAVKTYAANFSHPVVRDDIRNIPQRLDDLLPSKPDWVVGGPPCQGFSTVGKRLRKDPRNALIHEFRNLVELVEPSGFIVENVLGLKDMGFERALADSFGDLGYTVTWMVLRSADFGVPQLRRRIFFVGHQELGFFSGPPVTHAPSEYTTVWDAIGDLPRVAPGESAHLYDSRPFTPYQRRMREGAGLLEGHEVSNHPPELVRAISFIPDGGNRSSIPARYQPRSGFHNSYSRLNSKAPAVAVTSNMGKPSGTRCIHPFQDRGLTAREGARLQSFPDRFRFMGGITSQRLQVANAVPPLLAEAVGTAIRDQRRWSLQVPMDGGLMGAVS